VLHPVRADRDLRNLIRAIQKWGDIRQRYDVIVSAIVVLLECVETTLEADDKPPPPAAQIREAKLETKNRAVILQACDELIALGKDAIDQHKKELKGKKVAGETVRRLPSLETPLAPPNGCLTAPLRPPPPARSRRTCGRRRS